MADPGANLAANVYDELTWRGMVYDATGGLSDVFAEERVTAYIGFDPTASSLHVGSLLPVMALARLQRFGHTPIALVGGGTGMIGDPSGKSQERLLLSSDEIDANLAGLRGQLSIRRASSTTRTGSPPSACSASSVIPASISPSTTCCRRNR
jgi:tyrosyl-tRNA synthetase